MISAQQFVYLCEADPEASDTSRYIIRYGNHTAGVHTLAAEDVAEVQSYPGVDCLLKLTPGTLIDLDPRSLKVEVFQL